MVFNRKHNSEFRALILFPLGVDDPVVPLHYFFYDGQAYTCAFIGIPVLQPLKYFEYPAPEFVAETNSVVTYNDPAKATVGSR
jgi:hypothetical protein